MQTRGASKAKITLTITTAILIIALLYTLLNRIGAETPKMLPGGMRIPYISQLDFGETVCVLAGKSRSVASSGCGATCVSMVVSYLRGERTDPNALFTWAFDNGYYTGDGLSHECLTELAAMHGVASKWIDNSAEEIREALSNYQPVIAHVGPGTFTSYGHYIVLRGLDENGRVYVNDPSSVSRSEATYALDDIISQARTNAAFMILW